MADRLEDSRQRREELAARNKEIDQRLEELRGRDAQASRNEAGDAESPAPSRGGDLVLQ